MTLLRRRLRSVFSRLRPVQLVLGSTFLLLVLLLVVGALALRPVHDGKVVPLTKILFEANGHEVTQAVLYDQDSRVQVDTPEGRLIASYTSSNSETSRLVTVLAQSGTVRVDPQTGKKLMTLGLQFLVPVGLLATVFGLILTLGGGEGGAADYRDFSRVRDGARAAQAKATRRRAKAGVDVPTVTFADVAGAGTAVAELREVVDYLHDPARYAAVGAVPPKGVLLFGPPGCGKTLLARAVAGEAGVPFFSLSGSEFVESLVGVGAARVRDLFARVRAAAPAVLFIDELDAAGRRRGAGVGGGHDEREQTLNQLLVELDGFDALSGITVLGATNRPDILDPALMRAGRFDRHVLVQRPDAAGRLAILQLHGTGRPSVDGIDLAQVAARTEGFTGADLNNVWREAALLTVRAEASQIGQAELDEAVLRVLGGPREDSVQTSEHDRLLGAIHEAGHALVATALGRPPARVSVARRSTSLSHAALGQAAHGVLQHDQLLALLTCAVAGTAAEQTVLGQVSTLGEPDIDAATDLARDLAGRYGMSEGIGPVRVLGQEQEVFLGRDLTANSALSQQTLDRLDTEVLALCAAAQDRALVLVRQHRKGLDQLVSRLLAEETVEGDQLPALLTTARATARTRAART